YGPHRGMLQLYEGLRQSEEEEPTAAAPQDLRDDHRGNDRLAHARRQHDEGRSLETCAGDVHLVRAFLHGPAMEELVRDEHGRRTTRAPKEPLRRGRERRLSGTIRGGRDPVRGWPCRTSRDRRPEASSL